MILDAIRSRNTIPIPKSGLFIPVIYISPIIYSSFTSMDTRIVQLILKNYYFFPLKLLC